MIFQEELAKEAAELQRVIDIEDARCRSVSNNTDPTVVSCRLKLERALHEAREQLRLLRKENLL